MDNPTIRQMVEKKMREKGFDGLMSIATACQCRLDTDDFMICDTPWNNCTAGFCHEPDEFEKAEGLNYIVKLFDI